VARQTRQQKQQNQSNSKDGQPKAAPSKETSGKDASSKDASAPKASKVITNDEVPEQGNPSAPSGSGNQVHAVNYSRPEPGAAKIPPEQWKAQIQSQKNYISSLQSDMDRLNDSIHFAGGNCAANCEQWNERQQQKIQQVESMKAQLEDMKKKLEDLQESARQQGYGSSVYEP
jgi:hypothetical protein